VPGQEERIAVAGELGSQMIALEQRRVGAEPLELEGDARGARASARRAGRRLQLDELTQ